MDVFDNIKKSIEKVNKFIDLSDKEMNTILNHKQTKKAILDVDGNKYEAFRIIHNNSLGPGKGGIRYHPNVSLDEVKSLSFWMSLKNSLAGLPYGGAKGGIKVNPKELSEKQIEKLSRAYICAFHEYIGENKDIPAPDVYTNSKIMGYMVDEYEKIKGYHEPGVITGKPISLGGIAMREDATSRGGYIVLKRFLEKEGISKKITIAVQGFGNAGSFVAKMLHEEGYKIVAVSDSKGGIYSKDGIDIKEVSKIKEEGKSVVDLDYKKMSNKEILELDVDILILAALENQITKENSNDIKARYILELANGPVSSDADDVLFEKNIIVIPDILANSGGVVVSYFEWVQNKTGNIFEENFLKRKLEEIMKNSFERVYNLYKENDNMDMRTSAYIIALKRILEAEKSRGNI